LKLLKDGYRLIDNDYQYRKAVQMRNYRFIFLASILFLLNSTNILAADIEAKSEREALRADIEALKKLQSGSPKESAFSFGGYGEIHYNETESTGGDYTDIHRFVIYTGYQFADWIQLDSEVELEHAFASKDHGGEFKLEQLKVDFELSKVANVRVGRMLAPIGIINETHEPTTFNGVERPNFSKKIIPTTWSLEGIGLYGNIAGLVSYQLLVTSSLDGSKFSSGGIRSGRQHERPGMNDLAKTLRVEYTGVKGLKLGLSHFTGGVDNGNKGSSPGIDESVNVAITALDLQYSVAMIDLRAVQATTKIENADKLNEFFVSSCEGVEDCSPATVANEMGGFYVELAAHVLPESMKSGKLKQSDLVVFVRHENYDLNSVPADDVDADDSKNITELTAGLSFFPVENLVIKMDRQEVSDAADSENLDSRFNMGIGWHF
jgi:hypothetical protein